MAVRNVALSSGLPSISPGLADWDNMQRFLHWCSADVGLRLPVTTTSKSARLSQSGCPASHLVCMVVLLLPEETQPDGQLEGRHPHGGRGARVERLQVARRRRHARTAGGEGRQLNSSLTSPIFMLKFLSFGHC